MPQNTIAADVHDADLQAVINQQMKSEIGDSELTADEASMLRQKYGLTTPKFLKAEAEIVKRRN